MDAKVSRHAYLISQLAQATGFDTSKREERFDLNKKIFDRAFWPTLKTRII